MVNNFMLTNKHQGFTLIEIIISLVVISVALGTIITTTANSIKHGAHIKEKTIALWVAQNAIAETSIENKWPSSGVDSDEATMAGKRWYIQSKIVQTPDQNIRRMDVSVYADKKNENKVVSLTTYIIKPQDFVTQ